MKASGKVLIGIWTTIFLLCVSFCVLPNIDFSKKEKLENITYTTISKWAIPNGGYGKVVVLSEDKKDIEILKKFGLQLKYETKNDKNAFIWIYDSEEAAKLYETLKYRDLTKDEEKIYDSHFIGTYMKNGNTNKNEFTIMINGLNGSIETIKY